MASLPTLVRRLAPGAARTLRSAAGRCRPMATLSEASPHVDVVRYSHKNVKWTLSKVDAYSEALAVGFVENGLRPGDAVLSWLPAHYGEEHVLQFACSKAGLVLYNLDASQAISDPEGAKAALARALELTEASVLVSQEAGNDVSYARLVEAVVPEVRTFNFGDGMPFFSPRFPHLRLPVHTGFEVGSRPGMEPLKHLLCPADTLADQLGALPGGPGLSTEERRSWGSSPWAPTVSPPWGRSCRTRRCSRPRTCGRSSPAF